MATSRPVPDARPLGGSVPQGDVQQHRMGQVEGVWGPCPYLSVVAVARQALPSQAQ